MEMSETGPQQPLESREFDTRYRRWGLVHAVAVTLLVVVMHFSRAWPAGFLLAGWIVGAFASLYRTGSRSHPDGAGIPAANLLTSVRAGAAFLLVLLAVATQARFLPWNLVRAPAAWWLAGGLALTTTTDFLDGLVARRSGGGGFGGIWDMECDAINVLALSLGLLLIHSAPLFVLAVGLMRYLYVLAFRFDQDPPDVPRAYKLFAKSVTALLVSGLIALYAPFFTPPVRAVVIAILLAFQLASFLWDLILQFRHRSLSHG